MLSIERRLSALEVAASAVDDTLHIICTFPGETKEDAAMRAGFALDVSRRMNILYITQTDELL